MGGLPAIHNQLHGISYPDSTQTLHALDLCEGLELLPASWRLSQFGKPSFVYGDGPWVD